MRIIETLWWHYFSVTTYSLSSILIFILIASELYFIRVHKLSKLENISSSKTPIKLLWILTLLACFSFLTTVVCGSLSRISTTFSPSSTLCSVAATIGTITFLVGKCFMYCAFLMRIHAAFDSSVYKYSNKTLNTIGISAVLLSFFLSSLLAISIKSTYNPINEHNDTRQCILEGPLWLAAILVTYDICFQSLLLYLFINPFRKIMKNKIASNPKNTNNSYYEEELLKMCIKYIILTFISCSSTLILILSVPLLGTSALSSIDCFINSLCLLLCYENYKKIYKNLCCLSIKFTQCVFKLKYKSNQHQIRMHKIFSVNDVTLITIEDAHFSSVHTSTVNTPVTPGSSHVEVSTL